MGTAIVSIAQSRQTSFQRNDGYIALGNGSSFNRPIASNLFPTRLLHPTLSSTRFEFQSPNRVKPLSNSCTCTRGRCLDQVSIAQSRQTSFQQEAALRPCPAASFVSIAQSRQTSFQQRAAGLYRSGEVVCFNRPIASNLFPTQRASPACASRTNTFQSPNRVKPLSNVLGTELPTEQGAVSIAQSRQTSFQRSFVFVTKR